MSKKSMVMTEELLAKIRKAQDASDGLSSKILRCPYDNHRIADSYSGASGQIRAKCSVCGREIVIDLVSWRKVKEAE